MCQYAGRSNQLSVRAIPLWFRSITPPIISRATFRSLAKYFFYVLLSTHARGGPRPRNQSLSGAQGVKTSRNKVGRERRREKATNSRSSRVRRKRKDPLRKPRAVEVDIETGPENCQTANGPSKSGELEFGHISPYAVDHRGLLHKWQQQDMAQ